MGEKRLPGRERRERYGRRVDVIERFRLGREIVRIDGNEFRSAAITIERSEAVYARYEGRQRWRRSRKIRDLGIEGVRGSPFAV